MNKVLKENHRNMEKDHWTKDENPYYIFTCEKCGRWLYVKMTQINKKCLSCRRNHKVNSIKNRSEMIKGITAASRRVKELQHELARKEQGGLPDLRTGYDFSTIALTSNQLSSTGVSSTQSSNDMDHSNPLYKALLDIRFQSFPFYIIEMIAEELEIPKPDLKMLMQKFIKAKILIPLPNQYFKISKNLN